MAGRDRAMSISDDDGVEWVKTALPPEFGHDAGLSPQSLLHDEDAAYAASFQPSQGSSQDGDAAYAASLQAQFNSQDTQPPNSQDAEDAALAARLQKEFDDEDAQVPASSHNFDDMSQGSAATPAAAPAQKRALPETLGPGAAAAESSPAKRRRADGCAQALTNLESSTFSFVSGKQLRSLAPWPREQVYAAMAKPAVGSCERQCHLWFMVAVQTLEPVPGTNGDGSRYTMRIKGSKFQIGWLEHNDIPCGKVRSPSPSPPHHTLSLTHTQSPPGEQSRSGGNRSKTES